MSAALTDACAAVSDDKHSTFTFQIDEFGRGAGALVAFACNAIEAYS
jgi:hypothetical protein